MALSINEMKAHLVGGGARPSHFQVIITNPVLPFADTITPFMVKAASLPSYTTGKIEIPYFGRKIPIPGDRVWEDWQTTIINDENFAVRNALESWSAAINAPQRNIATLGSNPNLYKSQATVTQYGKDGSELRIYQFNGIFPTTVQSIELDWNTTDMVEEFQVTWAFDYCEVVGGSTGNANGS